MGFVTSSIRRGLGTVPSHNEGGERISFRNANDSTTSSERKMTHLSFLPLSTSALLYLTRPKIDLLEPLRDSCDEETFKTGRKTGSNRRGFR